MPAFIVASTLKKCPILLTKLYSQTIRATLKKYYNGMWEGATQDRKEWFYLMVA
ncbi:MAG: hypothetical protein WBM32_11565 [Crocosphaera sp.]